MKKIVFIGCVQSSEMFIKHLIQNQVAIELVVTKQESNYNSDFCDLAPICKKNGINFLYCSNVNDSHVINAIKAIEPDFIYCFGWSQLLKKELLSIPRNGVIGFHPAKLPNNKGRHPIIWALALGLEETASTFFLINEGVDAGDILSQEIIPITNEDNARSLFNKIMKTAKDQLMILTEQLLSGKIYGKEQRGGNAWRKRSALDGRIDFRMHFQTIYNLVRALSEPYPCAEIYYNEKAYRITHCENVFYNKKNIEPGKVLKVESQNCIIVKCADQAVKLYLKDEIEITEGDYL